ncbi:MAG: dienelactone hydrolase [Proteobacteria bacterium]|nr:dienelactone hydrolase [Pseudomonadota bacterium]
MNLHLRRAILSLALLVTGSAFAAQAGFRTLKVPGVGGDSDPISVALYYPTSAAESALALGPFTAHVAAGAAADSRVKGLIILSHGNAGSELGQTSLAEALARDGYLVAALRHPGDNWQDSSLIGKGAASYFSERPRQASRVIDALLQSPDWKDRIARDDKGPLVGAVGHSAGGYTVLALAGARPDLQRIRTHCANDRAQDPIFCGMTRSDRPAEPPGQASSPMPPLEDDRVRAVVALAPLGVVLTHESLAQVSVPTMVYEAELDRYLVPSFHAQWVARNIPGVDSRSVRNAWHYAFMDRPGTAIMTVDGDVGADPPGFDRQAFLKRLGEELPRFFDGVFHY